MVQIDDCEPIHIRELIPKDFYIVQILQNTETDLSKTVSHLMSRLILNPAATSTLSVRQTQVLYDWASENLLTERIMSVEQWLETAFHLCKQRWDSSIDWLETQPVPKILLMIDIVNKHVKEQEEEMKKAARK